MGASGGARQVRNLEERISVVGVVMPEQRRELENILSHTRWEHHLFCSIADAIEKIYGLPVSVVLCEQKLSDGTWMDLLEAAEKLSPRPQIIVMSADASMELWGEVLNCGGYDLLARPLRPEEIYDVVPMAWRQSKDGCRCNPVHHNFHGELLRTHQ
jgi:DNA-binding NtrC family response regulator